VICSGSPALTQVGQKGGGRIVLSRPARAILIGIAAIMIIGAALAFMLSNDNGNSAVREDSLPAAGSYKVVYYHEGTEILYRSVLAGTTITIEGNLGLNSQTHRLVGWYTKSDMTGSLYTPGTRLKIDRDTSLHAFMIGSEMFAIILPEKQVGYTITADPMFVERGGSSILSYSILPSHIDDALVIAVNGNPMKRNALMEIHLTEINEDQIVTVTGVFDRREHSITLPEKQIGYILTADAEKVHHGESYTLKYILLPKYEENLDFGIHINGVNTRFPVGGELLIEDVCDNHVITVTGVVPIEYNITVGKNITALIDGFVVTKATIDDIITIKPAPGYYLPTTFNSQITGQFIIDVKGYHVLSDVSFPSVLKIAAGENIELNRMELKSMFVCPLDKVKVTGPGGYVLRTDFINAACAINGVTYSDQGFSFSEDVSLPSVYSITYIGYHDRTHFVFFVPEGCVEIPIPDTEPTHVAAYFIGWGTPPPIPIKCNVSVSSIWEPMTFVVKFGPNLDIKVGNKYYITGEGITLEIKSNEKIFISCLITGEPLPETYGPQCNAVYRDGYYNVIGDCFFPGFVIVYYWETGTNSDPTFRLSFGEEFCIPKGPSVNIPGYIFDGWFFKGTKIEEGTIITAEENVYLIIANWIKIS